MRPHSRAQCTGSQAGSHQPLLQALVAIVLAGSSYVWAMSFLPNRESLIRHLSIPEEMVVKALFEVGENRIGTALDQINSLLAVSPNFRLAQLIKGDLLLARSRPIGTVGAGAPPDRAAELREEARARLARYAFRPPADLAPKYLLQLPEGQKYALVIDTSKSTLFVFENRIDGPRYVADYYVTVGKNGADKVREGDKRTPLGVYRVTSKMPRAKLTSFYGAGAFPLSYPNEWDRLRGRNGSGIWLHGTPSDTYSRPPRASDGCVVLTNQDLQALEQYLQLGSTPVVITDEIEWASDKDTDSVKSVLASQVEQWRHDWESKNTDVYLDHYSHRFSINGTDFAKWAAQKRQINAAKAWIKVGLSDLSLILYPGEGSLAVVTFDQNYTSDNLSNRMRKRQYWIKENDRWKIVYEGAA